MVSDKTSEVSLRVLRPSDAGAYAAIQMRVFPDYNSTRLGRSFCTRYYGQYAQQPGAFGLGAWRGHELLGQILACNATAKATIRKTLFYRALCAAAIRPQLAFQARYAARIFSYVQSFLRPSRQPKHGGAEDYPVEITDAWIEMPSMCVLPESRGLGLGVLLMAGAMLEADRRGFEHCWGQVPPENSVAQHVYEKLGWHVQRKAMSNGFYPCWGDLRAATAADTFEPYRAAFDDRSSEVAASC